jgi:hypothetical protein
MQNSKYFLNFTGDNLIDLSKPPSSLMFVANIQ